MHLRRHLGGFAPSKCASTWGRRVWVENPLPVSTISSAETVRAAPPARPCAGVAFVHCHQKVKGEPGGICFAGGVGRGRRGAMLQRGRLLLLLLAVICGLVLSRRAAGGQGKDGVCSMAGVVSARTDRDRVERAASQSVKAPRCAGGGGAYPSSLSLMRRGTGQAPLDCRLHVHFAMAKGGLRLRGGLGRRNAEVELEREMEMEGDDGGDLLGWMGKDGHQIPRRLDQDEEDQKDASESENDDDALPSYYNGRWYHNGQWHNLKEEKPQTREELLEEVAMGETQIREEMEGEAAQTLRELEELAEMQDKGHDHYPQEWLDTTETTDSGLEEAKTQGKEMFAAQLYLDSAKGDLDAVKKAMSEGAANNMAFCSPHIARSALHVAARGGHGEVCRVLVEGGWDLHALDLGGNTALHEAVRKKKVESARVLLELGSDVNRTNDAELKPLHLAVRSCCEDDMIDLLLEHGARSDEWIQEMAQKCEEREANPEREEEEERALNAGWSECGRYFDERHYVLESDSDYEEIKRKFEKMNEPKLRAPRKGRQRKQERDKVTVPHDVSLDDIQGLVDEDEEGSGAAEHGDEYEGRGWVEDDVPNEESGDDGAG